MSSPDSSAVELAGEQPPPRATRPRARVTSPLDVHVSRGPEGQAVVVHRRDGGKIGEVARNTDGKYVAKRDGRDLSPHTHQRAALFELIGTHNKEVSAPFRAPVTQTPLMQQFGIPAVSLATPAAGVSDGPRATSADSGDGDDSGGSSDSPAGLTPKGVTIYKRLRAKGFPAARALAFAKRAQSFGGSKGS